MAEWATVATCLTHEDIADAIRSPSAEYETPVLQLIAEARNKNYDTVSLPLTTDKWKKRWTEMCIMSLDATEAEKEAAAEKAEAWRSMPSFMSDEVTMSRLGTFAWFLMHLERY